MVLFRDFCISTFKLRVYHDIFKLKPLKIQFKLPTNK